MAIPVVQFPAATFDQVNPVMTGISSANQLYQQSMQNKYLQPMLQQQLQSAQLQNQMLQPQAQYAPQMTRAQLAYQQAQAPLAQAQTQAITQGNIPLMMSQAGLYGTEGQKNQFMLSNPSTMLPGMAGQIGSLNVLKSLAPSLFGSPTAAGPTQDQTVTQNLANGSPTPLPGLGSAGSFIGNNSGNSAVLPANPYGNQQPQQQSANGLPSVQDYANLMMQGMTAPIQQKIAQANFYNQRAKFANFSALPTEQQNYLIAQAGGMGYEPQAALNALSNGYTLSDLAQNKGLDPNNMPSPLYPASSQTVNLIQKRNQALSEINSIQPNLNNALSPYSRRFDGYSPSQISGAISGDNPDQQAQYLAARALQPEMASLRLKAMGGNVGIEAIKEVNNASMGNMKSFQGLVSPKVYASAQNYVDQWINQGANAANKVGLSGSLSNLPASTNNSAGATPAPPTMTKNINGTTYHNVNGKWFA